MVSNILKFVKRCSICIRADTVRPVHHSALAVDVNGIFDRVGVDLSFGYPTTIEAFKGIMVLIE